MNKHVEVILQAAQLEKRDSELNKQPVDVRVINPTPPSNVQIASSGGGGGGGGSVSTNPDVSPVNTEELLQKFNQENF